MIRLRLLLILAALVLLPTPAQATSVAYYSDDQLFDMSEIVMMGVVWRRDTDRSGYPRTEYEVETEECFKGCTSGSFVTMSFMGAPADALEDGDEWFMGMPSPTPGTRVIVYLARSQSGRLVPISLGLSHFTVFYHSGLKKHIAHRDVDQIAIIKPAVAGRDGGGETVIPRDRFATDVIAELREKRARQ